MFPSSTPSSSQATATTAAAATVGGPATSKLNTDAAPFVPSGDTAPFVPSGEIEFHYQQPVRNAGERQKTCVSSTVCNCLLFFRGMEGLL